MRSGAFGAGLRPGAGLTFRRDSPIVLLPERDGPESDVLLEYRTMFNARVSFILAAFFLVLVSVLIGTGNEPTGVFGLVLGLGFWASLFTGFAQMLCAMDD